MCRSIKLNNEKKPNKQTRVLGDQEFFLKNQVLVLAA